MQKRMAFVFGLMVSAAVSSSISAFSQAIDPNRTAKAGVASDARFIDLNIEHNKDVMFLARKASERSKDPRIREMAPQMLEDRSAMLYAMEQLKTAGSGSAGPTASVGGNNREAAVINQALAQVSGAEFDSLWVASMLQLHQSKLDEYTLARESVNNSQLQMAIKDALPILKKYISQLRIIGKDLARTAQQLRKEEAKKKAKS